MDYWNLIDVYVIIEVASPVRISYSSRAALFNTEQKLFPYF